MSINLDNLRPKKKISFETKEFGKVFVFFQSAKDFEDINREFPDGIENVDSELYIRKLFKYVCHPENKLDKGQYKPSYPSFSDKDVEKLDQKEIELFAEKYLQNNESLFKETLKPNKNENGTTVISIELGEVIYPRKNDESQIEYLHRLLVNQNNELIESFKSLGELWSDFSKDTFNQIRETHLMGETLKKSFDSLSIFPEDTFKQFNETFAKDVKTESLVEDTTYISSPNNEETIKELEDLAFQKEEARLRPIFDLSDKLEILTGVAIKATDYVVAMNESQESIAREIKSSGDSAVKYSKWSIRLGLSVLLLTAFSILFSAYAMIKSNQNVTLQNELIAKGVKALEESINLKDSLIRSQKKNINNINDEKNTLTDSLLSVQIKFFNNMIEATSTKESMSTKEKEPTSGP